MELKRSGKILNIITINKKLGKIVPERRYIMKVEPFSRKFKLIS